jgi:hypothetical protein
MKDPTDNVPDGLVSGTGATVLAPGENGVERRIFRNMALAVAMAAIASLLFAQWRTTTGLLVGGLLSLLNYRWLSTSSAAAFSVIAQGAKPQLKLTQYVLRYLVVGAGVVLAYKFDLVALPATIAGLCSFVVALFIEAAREFYFAIIHREEPS